MEKEEKFAAELDAQKIKKLVEQLEIPELKLIEE